MSKDIFIHGKSMTATETPPELPREEDNEVIGKGQSSSYESHGASQWKALAGLDTSTDVLGVTDTSEMDSLSEAASALGSTLKQANTAGIFGDGTQVLPTNIMQLKVKKLAKDAFTAQFEHPELPPSAVESVALFPIEAGEAKDTKNTTLSFYDSYLNLYEERRINAEKVLSGGRVSEYDRAVIQQFLGELKRATDYTREQQKLVDEYEIKG